MAPFSSRLSQRRWRFFTNTVPAAPSRDGAGLLGAAYRLQSFGLATSALFSWYVASLGSYNKTHGSLGAVIGFIFFFFFFFFLKKLDAEMEHQTVRDSTIGVSEAARAARGNNGRHGRRSAGLNS